MLMMPVSRPSATTGTCRMRCSVIVCISSVRPSSPAQVRTSAVMMELTELSRTPASSCRRRTTSRSLTIPSTRSPSWLTTSAPTLCSASSATSSRTVASGPMVTTTWLLLCWMTSLIFMIPASRPADLLRGHRSQAGDRGTGANDPPRSGASVQHRRGLPGAQAADRARPAARHVGVGAVVGGAEEGERGVVQVAVGGQRVAAPRPVGAVEGGEPAPGLAHDDVEGRHVVELELGFGGDVDGALGEQHVGPEVAVGAGAPAAALERDEVVEAVPLVPPGQRGVAQ